MASTSRNDETRGNRSPAYSLLGKSLERVLYVVPAQSDAEQPYSEPGFEVVNWGVRLEFADGTDFFATWVMEGENERLELGSGPDPPEVAWRKSRADDVTERPGWAALVSHEIEDVAVAWHVPGADTGEVPWAAALDFGAAGFVAIALGQPGRGIEYVPDSLVVIFDRAIADDYAPPAALHSASGVPTGAPGGG